MLNIFSCNLFSIARATNLCDFSFGLYFYVLSFSTFLLDRSLNNVVILVTESWLQKLIKKLTASRFLEAVKDFIYNQSFWVCFCFVVGVFLIAKLFSSTHWKSDVIKVFEPATWND